VIAAVASGAGMIVACAVGKGVGEAKGLNPPPPLPELQAERNVVISIRLTQRKTFIRFLSL
jgi:hypothetical protein